MSEQIQNLLLFLPIVVISIAFHEFAHCWSADRLGDDTPRQQGRVTLNPLVHLDPLGTMMIIFSALAGYGFGWGKPSPVNPNNFRKPMRDYMISALAGPVSNIIQLFCWAALIPLLTLFLSGDALAFAVHFASVGIIINLLLAIFNLLPVYPLDGHVVLAYFLPESARPIAMNPAWGILFLAIVLIPQLRDLILAPLMQQGQNLLSILIQFLVF